MKFQDILEAPPKQEEYVIEMWHNIYQNCQPFLKEVNKTPSKHVMYRGIPYLESTDQNDHYDVMGIKDVRLDKRTPKDTPQKDHDEVNQYFTQAYGHPYRNGLFVSGSQDTAASYGNAFAIFPIGKFEYIWHPEIKDLYMDVLEGEGETTMQYWLAMTVGLGKDADEWADVKDAYTTTELLEWLIEYSTGPYKQTHLTAGIADTRTEIMIWTEQYYYLHPSYLVGLDAWIADPGKYRND